MNMKHYREHYKQAPEPQPLLDYLLVAIIGVVAAYLLAWSLT
jgi:hypothetical protein